MHYIIDGHNLIPHVHGIQLSDFDDEARLIQRLEGFRRLQQAKIDLFFDRAPAGYAGTVRQGAIAIHSVRSGMTADQAILQMVRKMGKAAKNVTVVSSDRQVKAGVREMQAHMMDSGDFARMLEAAESESHAPGKPEAPNPEVEYWLREFQSAGRKK